LLKDSRGIVRAENVRSVPLESVTTPTEVPDSDSISGSFTAAVESIVFGARTPAAKVPPETKPGLGQASSLYYYYYLLLRHPFSTQTRNKDRRSFSPVFRHSDPFPLAQKQLHVGRARGWPLGVLVDRLTFTGATLFTTLSDTKSKRVPRPKA